MEANKPKFKIVKLDGELLKVHRTQVRTMTDAGFTPYRRRMTPSRRFAGSPYRQAVVLSVRGENQGARNTRVMAQPLEHAVSMILTKEQFHDAVLHGYALYWGYRTWENYLDFHGRFKPCDFGERVLSLAWQKYQEQSSNSDYIRFAIAFRSADETYYALSQPREWTSEMESICEDAYHHVTGVRP